MGLGAVELCKLSWIWTNHYENFQGYRILLLSIQIRQLYSLDLRLIKTEKGIRQRKKKRKQNIKKK
jgi:hypothetical protein